MINIQIATNDEKALFQSITVSKFIDIYLLTDLFVTD